MGVYIKGMEMPKSCVSCSFQGFGGRMNERILCMLTGTNDYINQQSKFADCPLVEVPTPHGRLIDADALLESIKEARKKDPEIEDVYIDDYFTVAEWVVSAQTIIESEVITVEDL